MAINFAIDTSVPDGSVITISQLDNATRDHKRDVKERMDDSIIDTGVAAWTTTTSKQLKKGLSRIHRTIAASKPISTSHTASVAGIVEDQLWVRDVTDTPVEDEPSFQYYDGAAWQPVKIARENILAGLSFNKITAVENKEAVTVNSATWVDVGTTPVVELTFTPESAKSVTMIKATGTISSEDDLFAGLRLRDKTAGATLIAMPVTILDVGSMTLQKNTCFTLIGYLTGVTAATTVALQVCGETAGNAIRINGNTTLDSEDLPTRIEAIELR